MADAARSLNRRIAARVERAPRGARPVAGCTRRQERRQPLDDLADRARREQSHRGRAREAGRGAGRDAGLAVRCAGRPRLRARRADPVARRDDQPQWQDPAPATAGATSRRRVCRSRCRSSRSQFPARRRVAFETGARDVRVHQQVWVLEGAIDITLGEERHRLREGDCLAMQLDRPTMFHNPTRKPARYAVVIASDTSSRR